MADNAASNDLSAEGGRAAEERGADSSGVGARTAAYSHRARRQGVPPWRFWEVEQIEEVEHDSIVVYSDELDAPVLACPCGWKATAIRIPEEERQLIEHLKEVGWFERLKRKYAP